MLNLFCVGVPQGSIYGPLLFVHLVNNLPTVARKCSTLMYANDTVILFWKGCCYNREKSQWRSWSNWICDNTLFLNTVTTGAILSGTHARLFDPNFHIVFKDWPMKCVYEFKYLGIVFDKNLSWNFHVKNIFSQVGKQLGMFGCIRGNLTSNCANFIYTAYICLVMDYWDTMSNCSLAATVCHWGGFKDMPLKLFKKWAAVSELWVIWSGHLW